MTDPEFSEHYEQFRDVVWQNVLDGDDRCIVVGAGDYDGLSIAKLNTLAYCDDEGNFDISAWNAEVAEACDGMALSFVSVAIPMCAEGVHFIAVACMELVESRFCALMVDPDESESVVPREWRAMDLFHPFTDFLPALRMHVVHHG